MTRKNKAGSSFRLQQIVSPGNTHNQLQSQEHRIAMKLCQRPSKAAVFCIAFLITAPAVHAFELPNGYWTTDQADAILAKTLRIHLSPPLDLLSDEERAAVLLLLEVGDIMQRLYEDSRHPDALAAIAALAQLQGEGRDAERAQMLKDLYRLSKGPIVTSLENERLAFLPVAAETSGKNVYPLGIEKDEIEQLLDTQPELRESLLHLRAIVRRSSVENIRRDLETLEQHPALDLLHPGLRDRLVTLLAGPDVSSLYALPYSVAYAEPLLKAYELLNDAAGILHEDDPAFSRYLSNRARDLLSDDYESGDASWVSGRFKNLNAQIGSYETYDDQLYGVKSFFALSLLVRDPVRSAEMASASADLQAMEDSLPYESSRKIREDIPVNVYNVVADFGQSRGANTATILPNESYLARQYGRTILLRGNILTNPKLFEVSRSTFEAAVHLDHHSDLSAEAKLYRTLWHEIGHYLGVDQTADGRDLGVALQDTSDLFEEMKSDLVSLYSVQQLRDTGYYSKAGARAVYAAGVLRVLQKTQPRRGQPYQTMQLVQWNWFLQHEVLQYDCNSQTLRINYDRYHNAVKSLLAEVLSIQSEGSRQRAEDFVQQYTHWDPELHGVVAAHIRAQETYRYTLVTYETER